MDLNVVLCTYNRSKSLIKTLESINQLRVTREIKWEFILVDNNSTDNTKQIVLDFINKSQHEVIYCFEKSQGLSYARNAGIKLAKGSIVAFTDDDVLIENNWLTNMFDAFNSHEEPWCVGGKILPIWGAVRPAWLADNMLGVLALLDRGDNKIILKLPDIWGANMAFKAQTFKEYGDFDTSLGRTKGKLYAGEETAII